jgi:hypothetical protein
MDKELKFSYRICVCKGVTKLEYLSDLYDHLSSEIVMIGKSVIVFN